MEEELSKLFENIVSSNNISVAQFYQNFKSCATNIEKIQLIRQFYEWSPPDTITGEQEISKFKCNLLLTSNSNIFYLIYFIYFCGFKGFQKDSSVSAEFREIGNKAYVKNNIDQALNNYNLAVRYAPAESKELGLAFANRSAVFQTQGRFTEALRDTTLAIKHSYPESLMPKLNQRIEACTKFLNTVNQNQNMNKIKNESIRRKQFCDEVLFNIKVPNPRIKNAEDFVEIKENSEFGRHVVVTKDVTPGM